MNGLQQQKGEQQQMSRPMGETLQYASHASGAEVTTKLLADPDQQGTQGRFPMALHLQSSAPGDNAGQRPYVRSRETPARLQEVNSTWDDGDCDANLSAVLHKLQEHLHIIE